MTGIWTEEGSDFIVANPKPYKRQVYRPNDKPVLLLDQDEPLAMWDDTWWNWVEKFGMDTNGMTRDTFTAHYATEHLNERDALIMRHFAEEAHWYHNLPVTPGAQDGVAELEKHFDIWVCTKPTAANKSCYQGKSDWIAEHFPSLHQKLFIAPNKGMLQGDILLDDAPAIEWIEQDNWAPVIFSKPFNQGHSVWADYPHFSWGDDIGILLDQVK